MLTLGLPPIASFANTICPTPAGGSSSDSESWGSLSDSDSESDSERDHGPTPNYLPTLTPSFVAKDNIADQPRSETSDESEGGLEDLPELVAVSDEDDDDMTPHDGNGAPRRSDESEEGLEDLPDLVSVSDEDDDDMAPHDGNGVPRRSGVKSSQPDVSIPDDVGPEWLNGHKIHSEIAAEAVASQSKATSTRRDVRATETIDYSVPEFSQWPRRVPELPDIPPPPVISKQLVKGIMEEARTADPNQPPGPVASAFVASLSEWREKLAEFFKLSKSDFPSNPRRAADRIQARLSFLPKERQIRIMKVIRSGYTIPFSSVPPPFFRRANGPDLASNKVAAWKALKKDIAHGAVRPCNLKRDGRPSVVSPVRTAPKG